MGMGASPGDRTKDPFAPRRKMSANQIASATPTSSFALEVLSGGSEEFIDYFLHSIVA
jgi:hypothetical protein